ncbi:uncharacterized protein LOC142597502 [Dermatophagoides farinae]|uniref:Transmembrane protein n=1 Tax=Dermatophagoides farinae TaxID=6954 RepID=A0A9D4NVR9_DERFA|nr:hypothetical protein HUG17_3632 [Dermatophagoides farinae]
MGHWILEVTKIGIYITLPLSSFIIFNHPSFYAPILYEWRKKIKPFTVNDEIMRKRQEEFEELLIIEQSMNESNNK